MIAIPLEERVMRASLVVEGEVVSQNSFWDANRQNIYTSNILKVFKVFKGELKEKQVEIITEGGTVGLERHVFSTSLGLTPGQQGTFFLQDQQAFKNTPAKGIRSTKVFGSEQGMISYDVRQNSAADAFNRFSSIEKLYSSITTITKTRYKTLQQNDKLEEALQVQSQRVDAQLAVAITNFSPTTASAGTGTVLTINGSGFGATRGNGFVEFKNADDGGKTFIKPLPLHYVSWSDTQIRVIVPGTSQERSPAGSGVIKVTANDGTTATSSSELLIPFVYSSISFEGGTAENNVKYEGGVANPLLKNANKRGGYTIQFAPSMQTRDAAVDGFQRAVTSWICATGVNWEIGEPVTSETTASDNRNTIVYASESTVGERVLARTISRYEGYLCGPNSKVVFFLKEFDMEINSSINWQYGPGAPTGGQFDFETVILHELGHAHQLGHVIRPREAIMHFSVEFNRTYRDLAASDIIGGAFVISRSVNKDICDIEPMIPVPANACRIFPNIAGLTSRFTAQGNAVEITWTSTDEAGVTGYVVERSRDGIEFQAIGTVAPKGNNSSYSFTDPNPLPFKAFYRIRVNYSNAQPRFSTRRSAVNPANLNKVIIGPNPVGTAGKIKLIYYTTTNTKIDFSMYDSSGRILFVESFTFNETDTEVEIDFKDLAGGVYFLKWNHSRGSGTERLLKQ